MHIASYVAIATYIATYKFPRLYVASYIFTTQIVQELLEEPPQDAAISGKNSVEIQVDIPPPPKPSCRDAQNQIAPEARHIGRQSTSTMHRYLIILHAISMVQQLRQHQHSVLPSLQLQQKLVLVCQFFLISVMLMMISLMIRVVLLQILHNQLFMKRPPVDLNLSLIYQLKSNRHI